MIYIPFLFLLSIIGTIGYKKPAISNKVLATPNHRTLHEMPIPKGGGIVFSILTVFSVLVDDCVEGFSSRRSLSLGERLKVKG